MFSLFLPILLHFPASFYNLFKSKNPSLYSLVRHGFIQHGSGSLSLFGAEPLICGAGVFMFFVLCKRKNVEKLAALQLALKKKSTFPFGVIGLAFFSVYLAQYSSIGEVTNKKDFLFVCCSTPGEAVGLNSNLPIMC